MTWRDATPSAVNAFSLSYRLDLIIVGAGSAGIAAGRAARVRGLSVLLLEARDRLGGRAHTSDCGTAYALDLGCKWLHSVLSAHAHNYQRFTRTWGEREMPYVIAGNRGHGLGKLATKRNGPLRAPMAAGVSVRGQLRLSETPQAGPEPMTTWMPRKERRCRLSTHPRRHGFRAVAPLYRIHTCVRRTWRSSLLPCGRRACPGLDPGCPKDG